MHVDMHVTIDPSVMTRHVYIAMTSHALVPKMKAMPIPMKAAASTWKARWMFCSFTRGLFFMLFFGGLWDGSELLERDGNDQRAVFYTYTYIGDKQWKQAKLR